MIASIRQIVTEEPGIERVNELISMHLGPQDVLVTLSLDFDDKLTAGKVEGMISGLEKRIKGAHPEVTRVFIEAQSWGAHLRSLKQARRPTEATDTATDRAGE